MQDVSKHIPAILRIAKPHHRGGQYWMSEQELIEFARQIFLLGSDSHVMHIAYKQKGK